MAHELHEFPRMGFIFFEKRLTIFFLMNRLLYAAEKQPVPPHPGFLDPAIFIVVVHDAEQPRPETMKKAAAFRTGAGGASPLRIQGAGAGM